MMTTLDDTLGIPPIPTNQQIITTYESSEPIPVSTNADIEKAEKDFELARCNITSIAEIGAKALEEAADFASQSQAPRAFEVVATMLAQLTQANKELLNLHKTLKDIKKVETRAEAFQESKTVNNNLILTTSELLRQLTNMESK